MANHAKTLRLEPSDNITEKPTPKPKRHEWFTLVKIADNDYRVASVWGPLPEQFAKGPKMTVPGEVFDRWHIDCVSLLDRFAEEF